MTRETPEETEVAEERTGTGSSSSGQQTEGQGAAEGEKRERQKQLTAVGGSLTMTHRVDARGESFRIQSKEAKDPRDRGEVWYSCKKHGHEAAGKMAWEYFQKALAGRIGKGAQEKNDYDYLSSVLGGEAWRAGLVGEEICVSAMNRERERRGRFSKLLLWERVQG